MTGESIFLQGGARICPTCHCPIPEGQLACLPCAAKRAAADARASQSSYFGHVLHGRLELRLRRRTRYQGAIHIALFNYKDTAFCGESLLHYTYQRFEKWDETEIQLKTCSACYSAFLALVRECEASAARTE